MHCLVVFLKEAVVTLSDKWRVLCVTVRRHLSLC